MSDLAEALAAYEAARAEFVRAHVAEATAALEADLNAARLARDAAWIERDQLRAQLAPRPLTRGGEGHPVMRPATLPELDAALGGGDRIIAPRLTGDVALTSQRYLRGANVTLDFGGRLRFVGYGLGIWGAHGASDVIARGVRVKDAGNPATPYDGIQIKAGARRVIVERCHVDRAQDGACDLQDVEDIEVRACVLANTANTTLIQRCRRVRFVGNLILNGQNRNIQADGGSDVLMQGNHVIFTAYGVLARPGTQVRVIGNTFHQVTTAFPVTTSRVFADAAGIVEARDNVSLNGFDLATVTP